MTSSRSTPPAEVVPRHVKAARALLAWSQQDLAKAAKVATSTVADFERGKRTPVSNNTQAIRTALEGAGVRFLPTGAVIGPAIPVIELLHEAGRQPFEGAGDANEATMFQYYVAEILSLLDQRDDVDLSDLVKLEWNYLRLLEHSRRPPMVLLRALSEQPALFIQMLSAIFKPTEESGVVDPEPPDPEQARAVATQAYRLLGLWNRIPGTRDDGTIDGEVLETWIKEARTLAKAAGRDAIADDQIGKMLSASPMGADGVWPAEQVRDVLDLFRSKAMIEGFQVGKANRRGVTTRMPRDGGALERAEAASYRTWAQAVSYEHPHTAKALDHLADGYERKAQLHDEDAERLDWEA